VKYNESIFNGKLQSVSLLTEVNFKTSIAQEKKIFRFKYRRDEPIVAGRLGKNK